MNKKYKVITLCGSTRFKDEFMEAQKNLTLQGNIVISVGLFGHSGDNEVWENMDEGTLTKTKEMLDDMHKRKIDMADEIFVINVNEYIDALRQAKKENYEMIYNNKSLNDLYENEIRPMFGELYEELLRQAESGDKSSVFYRHHMAYMEKNNFYVKSHVRKPYAEQEKNQLVVDYLASMTDDYFIALYHYLFPKGKHDVKFVGYFDL